MNPIQWLGLAMSAAFLLAAGGCKDKTPPARASAVPEVVVRTVELRGTAMSLACRKAALASPTSTKAACMPGRMRQTRPL